MRKVQAKNQRSYIGNEGILNLAIMIVFFLCGIAAGCIVSAYSSTEKNLFLLNDDILAAIQQGREAYAFGQTYFNLIKYPLIIFILGLTAFGYFTIPPVVCFKGFFMAFSVSTVLKLYGSGGFSLAIAMFGIQAFFSIPIVLIASSFAFEVSKLFRIRLTPSKSTISKDKKIVISYIAVFAIIMILMLLFAFLDVVLTPPLISISLKNLT